MLEEDDRSRVHSLLNYDLNHSGKRLSELGDARGRYTSKQYTAPFPLDKGDEDFNREE